MTIKIEQTCEKCGTTRELKIGGRGAAFTTIKGAAEQGGWREILGKDICSKCIDEFVGGRLAQVPA